MWPSVVAGDIPRPLRNRLRHVARKLERLMRRRPKGLVGPAGLLATLLDVATLRSRETVARRARRRWRRTLRRRAETRAELRDLEARARLILEAREALAHFLAGGERLAFPTGPATPEVSIILVVWNQAHFVLKCLRALLADALRPSFEVILVDNASGSETQQLLSRLDGVRVLRSPTNAGFLLACNQGAAMARGRAMLLLNSDAFVRPGALATAVATLQSEPDIGAVGGRLILPDGRLQEAGCYVAPDGVTRGRGRGLAAEAPEAMIRRDVDYCSGAFLLIKAQLWRRLGGFDEVYAPGYYEEADFCLRLAAAGFRVVVEPRIAVDHFELGSEIRTGDAARASERNRLTFAARHAEALSRRPASPA
jgi:GT2 family glycosyltransferase